MLMNGSNDFFFCKSRCHFKSSYRIHIGSEDVDKTYLDNFCQIVRDRGFADLPGLSVLKMED